MTRIEPGESFPLGPSVQAGGTNFSVYAKRATGVEILLFDGPEDPRPSRIATLDPVANRTGHYWHAFLPGVSAGQVYGYCAIGPFEPREGVRYDAAKLLLDPYAKGVVTPRAYDRAAHRKPGDTTAKAMRSVVLQDDAYDWAGDRHPRHAWRDTVIYEMHVRGFTAHPSSGLAPELRGTYRGAIEKIPYLVDLGVTAVELLPVYQYDAQDAPAGLVNYWGYAPVSFFAPHAAYAVATTPQGVLDEFRDMVKAFHRAGIEVILDVVYNHTAEGDEDGPTLCLKGLENHSYYMLDRRDGGYLDFTGCGNTVRANHPVVQRMILESLEFWAREMRVDGFRFDLASILSRDKRGNVLEDPPVLLRIDTDPVLASSKLIAEAWDAGGLEQVGQFVGDRWKEWNGRFRDDVRRFVRGDEGTVPSLKERLFASPDLYLHKRRGPEESINFVTAHDGFTLNDLVSYDEKHNEANLSDAGSGSNWNHSHNHGVEGETDDPGIQGLRARQIKNFLALNVLAMGTPMLLMGDEVRRTQRGNNNAYCQDNEISWFDWRLVDRHPDLLRYVKRLIALRKDLRVVDRGAGESLESLLERSTIRWHGVEPDRPDHGPTSHSLAVSVEAPDRPWRLYLIANAYREPLDFRLPTAPVAGAGTWLRILDTNLPSPHDITDPGRPERHVGETYRAYARSVVLLLGGLERREIP